MSSAEYLFSECLFISFLMQFAAVCGFSASSGFATVPGRCLAERERLGALVCAVLRAPGEEGSLGDNQPPGPQRHG